MRLRLTALCILLLMVCCVGLTLVLNLSAYRMADAIEAIPLGPSFVVGEDGQVLEATPAMPAAMPSEASQLARSRFFNQSWVFVAVIVLAGGALTYYISGRALRPLKGLSRQMKNRTVHNLADKLPVPESRDEIAALTESFNEMSAKLDGAFAMQKRFSQSAAHELRTPLTVIKTKLEVFGKKPAHTTDEYDNLLATVAAQTDRLSGLVQSLLNLASMDALECDESVELLSLLTMVAEELEPLASEREITVSVDGNERTVSGNVELLYQAIYNLAENAIKYNNDGGSVVLRVLANAVEIADNGIGIPVDQREQVFEPFYRVDKSRSRRMGGAGLGLSTVKAIISKHGGSIAIKDNSGGGSRFVVNL